MWKLQIYVVHIRRLFYLCCLEKQQFVIYAPNQCQTAKTQRLQQLSEGKHMSNATCIAAQIE